MLTQSITVSSGQQYSAWVDLAAVYADTNPERESWSLVLSQLVWPSGYDQASVTLEFADDDTGTNEGALHDIDGSTVLSEITKPATGVRTQLQPANFCFVGAVRIKLPANASGAFTFSIGMRRVS